MTLLLFCTICFLGFLAFSQGKDIRRDPHTEEDRRRHLHNAAGQGEIIDVSFTIVAQEQSRSTPVQNVAAPMSTSGITHQVTVGGAAGQVYIPNTLKAAVGDKVQFNFLSKNHTITQSTFGKPCVKLQGGVDSGFMPNPNNTKSPPPSFVFHVNDTKPKWFYCRQKGHCGTGMTFSINPTFNQSHANFMHLAILQNGTADGLSGTPGNYTTFPSFASTATPVTSPSLPPIASVILASLAPTASAPPPANLAAPPPPGAQSGIVTGSGGTGCACSCLCGVSAFPAGAGIGMFGGYSGSVPAT